MAAALWAIDLESRVAEPHILTDMSLVDTIAMVLSFTQNGQQHLGGAAGQDNGAVEGDFARRVDVVVPGVAGSLLFFSSFTFILITPWRRASGCSRPS